MAQKNAVYDGEDVRAPDGSSWAVRWKDSLEVDGARAALRSPGEISDRAMNRGWRAETVTQLGEHNNKRGGCCTNDLDRDRAP